MLAVIGRTFGDRSEDYIFLLDLPSLTEREDSGAYPKATDLSWQADGRHLLVCSGGRIDRHDTSTFELSELPFYAELCRCHPTEPFCAFFSSGGHGEHGSLFIVNLLDNCQVGEECEADGIRDMAWSADGKTVYAVSDTGQVWIGLIPLGYQLIMAGSHLS
jgi:hypothetical protein